MRLNLTAQLRLFSDEPDPSRSVILTVEPSYGVLGEFSCTTTVESLVQLLRMDTELQVSIIERFARDLVAHKIAKLLDIEVNDRALIEIGYFID